MDRSHVSIDIIPCELLKGQWSEFITIILLFNNIKTQTHSEEDNIPETYTERILYKKYTICILFVYKICVVEVCIQKVYFFLLE